MSNEKTYTSPIMMMMMMIIIIIIIHHHHHCYIIILILLILLITIIIIIISSSPSSLSSLYIIYIILFLFVIILLSFSIEAKCHLCSWRYVMIMFVHLYNCFQYQFHEMFMSSCSRSSLNTCCWSVKVMIRSCHKFAYAMAAQLSWHMQNCDMIISLDSKLDMTPRFQLCAQKFCVKQVARFWTVCCQTDKDYG